MYTSTSATFSLSIFYAQSSWDRLLKYLLQSLMIEIRQKEKKISFNLFFSAEQGKHIRVIFKSIESPELLRDFCTFKMSRFLQDNPSRGSQKRKPQGIFMDFDNNSFYFNSFRPVTFRPAMIAFDELESFQRVLSETMLHIFSRDVVSKENIFSFFLYMQIASLGIFRNQKEAKITIGAELSKAYKLMHPSKLIQFEYQADRLFRQNEGDLLTILNRTPGDLFPDEWNWLRDWTIQCNSLAQDSRNLNTFRDLVFMIAMHIDFKTPEYGILSLAVLKRLLVSQTNQLITNQ